MEKGISYNPQLLGFNICLMEKLKTLIKTIIKHSSKNKRSFWRCFKCLSKISNYLSNLKFFLSEVKSFFKFNLCYGREKVKNVYRFELYNSKLSGFKILPVKNLHCKVTRTADV